MATKISPFGATYIQRGLSSPSINLVTVNPAGAMGVLPAGQPITLELLRADAVAYGAGNTKESTAVLTTLLFDTGWA